MRIWRSLRFVPANQRRMLDKLNLLPADGFIFDLENTVPLVANPTLFPKLPFSPEKDFAPVSLVVTGPSIIVAHPSVPARDVAGLIARAKARPRVINYSENYDFKNGIARQIED